MNTSFAWVVYSCAIYNWKQIYDNAIEVPSVQTCYQMIEEMGMLPHIVTHSEQVCRVALCLVENMQHSSAARLDRGLVQAAALLHDITKTRSFETGEDHAFTGKNC